MSAISGQAGLKLALENTFRLILIDRELPDMPGPALLKQLRVLQPNAACLAMCLKSSNNVGKEVREEGFDDVLFKPFGQDAVDDLLQSYFQVSDLLTRQDNIITIAPFQGRPERLDRYYTRLSQLAKDSVKEIAEACFENVVMDAGKLPADPSRMAQLVTDFDASARSFGLAVWVVGPAAVKRALENFEDTKDVRVVETLADVRA
jgi:CheY-like chemotaxis protein